VRVERRGGGGDGGSVVAAVPTGGDGGTPLLVSHCGTGGDVGTAGETGGDQSGNGKLGNLEVISRGSRPGGTVGQDVWRGRGRVPAAVDLRAWDGRQVG